jgi:23S rRNA pseudouridine2605 synthase
VSVRLNKLLASRGLGARRKCDALIAEGQVRVNGQVVTEPGRQVEPGRDRIEVRGRPLPAASPHRVFMLHKPVGVISTLDDPEGRRSLRDFLPPGARVFPVGRLDADTSGLILLTNDGELAHHLMHPRYGVAKRYRVHVEQGPSESQLERLRRGIEFEPGRMSAPAQVWLRAADRDEAVIELALHEGRHRQVRRMCEAAGLVVRRLHRWGYGPLRLGDLARGLWRELSEEEVAALRAASARPSRREPGRYTGRRTFDRPRPRGPSAGGPMRVRSGRAPFSGGEMPRFRDGGRGPARRAGPRERTGLPAGGRGERSGFASTERPRRPGSATPERRERPRLDSTARPGRRGRTSSDRRERPGFASSERGPRPDRSRLAPGKQGNRGWRRSDRSGRGRGGPNAPGPAPARSSGRGPRPARSPFGPPRRPGSRRRGRSTNP